MRQWQRGLATLLSVSMVSATSLAQAQSGEGDDLDALLADESAATDSAPEAAAAEAPAPASAPTVAPDANPEVVDTIPIPQAEEPLPESKPQRAHSRLVEEIVVTAQKREESVQDVPISIAAFSADALDARGAFDTKALATITPALSITEFGGYSFVYIRGVGTDAFVPSADPSVTTYVDGVFVPTSQGMATDFGGIERVEVLKGPQGTLFGRNATGGAISVITKKPGDEFEASSELQLGSYNERRAKGFISSPLTDSIGASLDLLYKEYDNQYTHASRKLPKTENKAARVRLNWHPSETFDIDAAYFHSEQDTLATLISKNIAPSPLGTAAGIQPQRDDYVANTDYETFLTGSQEVASLGVTWSLPWLDLKLFGSDQLNITPYTAYDFDGSPQPLVGFNAIDQFTDAQTAELQFVSRPDGFLGESFEWIFGAYYLKSEGGYKQINLQAANSVLQSGISQAGVENVPDILVDLIGSLDSTLNTNIGLKGTLGTDSLSYYSQITWHALDWMDLTLGGRYQDEDRFLTAAESFIYDANTGAKVPLFNFDLESSNTQNFSSKAVVSVRPKDGWMFYLSRSEGFKSGTYNIINIYNAPDYVKPELVTSYELGMKADFFDGLLRLNAAIFDNSVKDKQVSIVSVASGGAVSLSNAEEASVRGAEFDLVLVPFSEWNPGLVITANGAYIDGVYDKFTNGQGFDPQTGVYNENQDFSGKTIERNGKYSGGLGVVQTFAAGENGEMEVGVDAYYNSGYFYSPGNSDNYKEDPYTLTNARLSYLYQPWNLRLSAFGKNILNESYHTGLFQTDFGILSNLAYEAQYGLRVEWNFQ